MSPRKVAMFQPYVSDDALPRVDQVLRGRWVGQGALVEEFERGVEKTLGIPHAVAVNASSSANRHPDDLHPDQPPDPRAVRPCGVRGHPV